MSKRIDVLLPVFVLATLVLASPVVRGQTTRFVDDDNCPGPGSGTQVDPFCTIQAGIDAGINGDEVIVAPGTYVEVILFGGKAIAVRSSGGSGVTTIDGNNAFSGVVICNTSEGPGTVLDGFTVTGGLGLFGSGMRIDGASPTVTDCTFIGNSTLNSGGGMRISNGNPTVTGCRFEGNSAANGGGVFTDLSSNPAVTGCFFVGNDAPFGGGMANFGGSAPTVSGCTFSQNIATDDGGGMYNEDGSNPDVTACIFNSNGATFGGGIHNDGSDPSVVNCVFSGNVAGAWGGGMYNVLSDPTVTNCTFSANVASAAGFGGGGMMTVASLPVVTNCIFWSNTDNSGQNTDESAQIHVFSGGPVLDHSCVEGLTGGLGGTGNIGLDPGFFDELGPDAQAGTGDENHRLTAGSPCIDAGDSTAVALATPGDLDGNIRAVNDPATTDTGVAVFGLTADMGAYELQADACTGDFDKDGDVDLADFAEFAARFTGPV